jgi:hypothetical protein
VEGSTPSEAQKIAAWGAPATPRVSAPSVWICVCVRERESAKHRCQGCRGLGLTNTLSGSSGNSAGHQKEEVHGNPEDPQEEDGRLGCSGRSALRRRQCNGPLPLNGQLVTDVISVVTDTDSYSRNEPTAMHWE